MPQPTNCGAEWLKLVLIILSIFGRHTMPTDFTVPLALSEAEEGLGGEPPE